MKFSADKYSQNFIFSAKNSTCVSVEKGPEPQFNFCSSVFECFDGGVLSSGMDKD